MAITRSFRALPQDNATPREIALVTNRILDGKINSVGEVTLAANESSTTVSDERAGDESVIQFMPMTANAAAEIGAGGFFVSATAKKSFTITHANNAQTDRTFRYVILH